MSTAGTIASSTPGAGGQAPEATRVDDPDLSPLRVVLCGSFRRDIAALRSTFEVLQLHYEVLSPTSLQFVDLSEDFVRLPHELHETESEIEQRHLDALLGADFVWLHAPEGHIGISATFELGHAKALGIPIFSDTPPAESQFKASITVVRDPTQVVISQSVVEPGNGLRALQLYYERAAGRRGWSGESAQDTLLLMTEEMGELARAVRKSVGLARDGDWEGQDVAEELADVQLYLVHLATVLGVDLAQAVTDKELVNAARVSSRGAA